MPSTKSKMEAKISDEDIKFQRELLGRGPEETKTYIMKDMVIVRLKGVFTQEEKHLVKTDQGRKLVKAMRQTLRETYADKLESIVSKITECQVLSSHSDISTKMGERIEMYILDRDLDKQFKEKKSRIVNKNSKSIDAREMERRETV